MRNLKPTKALIDGETARCVSKIWIRHKCFHNVSTSAKVPKTASNKRRQGKLHR